MTYSVEGINTAPQPQESTSKAKRENGGIDMTLEEIKQMDIHRIDKKVFDWLIAEAERLQTEVSRWKENYQDYCDLQLDLFRKAGMTEAAKRCAEIAFENGCLDTSAASGCMKQFKRSSIYDSNRETLPQGARQDIGNVSIFLHDGRD